MLFKNILYKKIRDILNKGYLLIGHFQFRPHIPRPNSGTHMLQNVLPYIILLAVIFPSPRAVIFIDSVLQREAVHYGKEKIELQIRRATFYFPIFPICIFSHIIQPLDLLHCDSVSWVCVGKCPPHDTGLKRSTQRLLMGVPGMCKWENCYQPALQTGNDSSHQKRLRSSCHNHKTRIKILSEKNPDWRAGAARD